MARWLEHRRTAENRVQRPTSTFRSRYQAHELLAGAGRLAVVKKDAVVIDWFEKHQVDGLDDLRSRTSAASCCPGPGRTVETPKDHRAGAGVLDVPDTVDRIAQMTAVMLLEAKLEPSFPILAARATVPGEVPSGAQAVARKRWWKPARALDLDVRPFSTRLAQAWLMKFSEHRTTDGRMLRLIRKWFQAEVIEDGRWSETPDRPPQGRWVLPFLSSVYLHHALDRCARTWRNGDACGQIMTVRWAGDCVVGLEYQGDDNRSGNKTRRIQFWRFAAKNRTERGSRKRERFNLQGVTHISGEGKSVQFWLWRITTKKPMRSKLHEANDQPKWRWRHPIPEQGQWLATVFHGCNTYYAVPGNVRGISTFRTQLTRPWHGVLRRRSQPHHLNWGRMKCRAAQWLPPARVLHPYPEAPSAVRTQSRSPVQESHTLRSVQGATPEGGPCRDRNLLPIRVVVPGKAHLQVLHPMGNAEVETTTMPADSRMAVFDAGSPAPILAFSANGILSRVTLAQLGKIRMRREARHRCCENYRGGAISPATHRA